MRLFVDEEIHFTGTESVKDVAKPEQPVTAIGKNNVSKVGETIESDDR